MSTESYIYPGETSTSGSWTFTTKFADYINSTPIAGTDLSSLGNTSGNAEPGQSGQLLGVVAQTGIYITTAVLTVLSNTLNLVVLQRVPNCFDEVTQLILKCLVVTDLLTGLLCTSLTVTVSTLRHLQLTELCAVRRCFCSTFVTLSSLFVGFACFDRYMAITRPLRYHNLITSTRAKIVIVSSVLLSSMIGGSSVFPSAKTTLCISNFSSDSALPFRPSLLLTLTVIFFCLGVSTYTNLRVVIIAVRQSFRVANEPLNDNAPNIVVQRLRPALRGLTSVVIATSGYCIAVIPWAIVSAAQLDPRTTISSPDIRFFTSLLMLSNSYWNAFIFLLLNRKFRAAVKLAMGFKEIGSSESYSMPSTVSSK